MHNDDIRLRVWTPGTEAEIIERSILMQTLALHLTQLTILELAMRVDRDWADFAQRDAVEVAVRELSRDGLLTCDCRRIAPSRPILRFEQLLGGGI